MKILILDDDPNRLYQFCVNLTGHDTTCVQTAEDCIEKISNNDPFDAIFLDHDLGGKTYVKSGKGSRVRKGDRL